MATRKILVSKKQRASLGLYGAVSKEYTLPGGSKKKREKIAGWVDELTDDAAFNFESYADCFVSENLIRKYIKTEKLALSAEAKKEAQKWKDREKDSKGKGNISIPIRREVSDLSYLSMDDLANLVDKAKDALKEAALSTERLRLGDGRPLRAGERPDRFLSWSLRLLIPYPGHHGLSVRDVAGRRG